MAIFTSFADTLPDPAHYIGDTGSEDLSGQQGPGYSEITVTAMQPKMMSMTAGSNRRSIGLGQRGSWELTIKYNDMPRDVFDTVYSFLLDKKYSMEPFYVNLPQYDNQTGSDKVIIKSLTPDYFRLSVANFGGLILPKAGDMFRVSTSDYRGIYKVLRVETPGDINESIVGFNDDELYTVFPSFGRTTVGYAIRFTDIKMLCVQEGKVEYSVDDKNLYSLSLKTKEVIESV